MTPSGSHLQAAWLHAKGQPSAFPFKTRGRTTSNTYKDRSTYLAGLEQASVHMNIKPFAEFIAERTSWSTSKAA